MPSLLELCDGFVVTKRKGKGMQGRLITTMTLVLASACATEAPYNEAPQEVGVPCDTTQIFGNAQHTGPQCSALAGLRLKATAVVDPSAQQESDDRGFYSVHQGIALTSGDWAYLPVQRGYTGQRTKASKTWGIEARSWVRGSWDVQWRLDSPFRAVDAINPFSITNRYEQLFQPVLVPRGDGGRATSALYVPGVSGTVLHVDPMTGAIMATVDPFAGTGFSHDARTAIQSALAAHNGAVYYTVVAWDASDFTSIPPRSSWLVRIDANDHATVIPWTSVAAPVLGIPQRNDLCQYGFGNQQPQARMPWPPSPTAQPPMFSCGGQVPAINVAPMFTSDGRIILTTSENNAITYAYMIAIDETTLAPLQAFSLRQAYKDGCGVFIPYSSTPNDDPTAVGLCRLGTTLGNNPEFNHPFDGREYGIMEASPVELPDGRICIGTYSGSYNNDVGHLSCFGPKGELTTYRYGWESTPAVRRLAGGSFELLLDDSSTTDGTDPGGEFATARLRPDLTVKTRTVAVNRPDVAGNDYLNGQLAVDFAGNAYALNARGTVEQIAPNGAVLATLELGTSIEPLSHEASWGTDDSGNAVLYIAFGGVMYAIGAADATTGHPEAHPPVVAHAVSGAKNGDLDAQDPGIPAAPTSAVADAVPASLPESISDVKPHAGCGSLCFGDSTCNVGFPDSSLCFRCVFNFCGGFRP